MYEKATKNKLKIATSSIKGLEKHDFSDIGPKTNFSEIAQNHP